MVENVEMGKLYRLFGHSGVYRGAIVRAVGYHGEDGALFFVEAVDQDLDGTEQYFAVERGDLSPTVSDPGAKTCCESIPCDTCTADTSKRGVYHVSAEAKAVEGHCVFRILARSKEEALSLWKDGAGEFIEDASAVTSYETPTIDQVEEG